MVVWAVILIQRNVKRDSLAPLSHYGLYGVDFGRLMTH